MCEKAEYARFRAAKTHKHTKTSSTHTIHRAARENPLFLYFDGGSSVRSRWDDASKATMQALRLVRSTVPLCQGTFRVRERSKPFVVVRSESALINPSEKRMIALKRQTADARSERVQTSVTVSFRLRRRAGVHRRRARQRSRVRRTWRRGPLRAPGEPAPFPRNKNPHSRQRRPNTFHPCL
jgi:hypothetical protein